MQEIARKEGNSVACMAPELAIENRSQSVVLRFKVLSRFSRREPVSIVCVCWRRANAVRITAASTPATDCRTECAAAVANSKLGAACFRGMKSDAVVSAARLDNLRARAGAGQLQPNWPTQMEPTPLSPTHLSSNKIPVALESANSNIPQAIPEIGTSTYFWLDD